VTSDAIGTLGDVRDGDRDELLGLLRQGAIGEHRPAERLERGVDIRGESLAPLGELRCGLRIERLSHRCYLLVGILVVSCSATDRRRIVRAAFGAPVTRLGSDRP
jgi:hypothetical protein